MPKLSDTMSEGTLVKWLKKEGDTVSMDEDIAEVETDKATMTMPSFDEGILYRIYVKEGETVVLGASLALILEPGEEPPADADQAPSSASAADPAEDKAEKPVAEKAEAAAPAPAAAKSPPPSVSSAPTADGRIKASPLARKLAEEQGVDLRRVTGSGPGGRIIKKDVLNAPAGGGGGSNLGLLPAPGSRGDQSIPLTGMRRVIAQRLLESKTTIPHFYLNIEIDTEPLMTMREQVNAASTANGGPKYTVNDFIMRATVLATDSVPAVNASFQGDSILQHGEINLSVAVAIEEGLVTPVIRSAQMKSIKELAGELKELAGRAKDKKLTPAEMQGGTITISNLGAFGIGNFDAIINPPQAAILAIGTITKQPVVNAANQIVPGQRMWIGMSCDHRVIDGAVGARFLSELKRFLETPILLIS
ncbi:MAG: 2-oxo acid dehydrogenase subunit E2 [Verrucomicrobiales bacterium]|nr:2-oxo acid dehydrogenase subunit E2 [Verrucomicrobiales bacterium]